MKLVIVGNGFDSAHELHTNYKYFKEYIKNTDKEEYEFLSILFGEEFESIEFWNSFEENLSKSQFENFVLELKNKNDCKKNSSIINYNENNLLLYFYEHINKLKEMFCVWIKKANNFSGKTKKEHLLKCFEDSIVFCFNYTSTIENLYKHDCYHIHGSIENVDIDNKLGLDSIVFGHLFNTIFFESDKGNIEGNIYFSVFDNGKNIPIDEISFSKQFDCSENEQINNILTEAENRYEDIFQKKCRTIIEKDNTGFFAELSKKANTINEVIVLGHSMSVVDLEYYKKIVEILKSKLEEIKWIVSYYDGEDSKNEFRGKLEELGILSDVEFISI